MTNPQGLPISAHSVDQLAELLASAGRDAASRSDIHKETALSIDHDDEQAGEIRIAFEISLQTETLALAAAVNAELFGRMLVLQADTMTALHRVARALKEKGS